jgi:hypothetical protein
MPNFSVQSDKLIVRPVQQSDIEPPKGMKKGPDLRYMTLPDGPRQFNDRMQRGGAVAAAVQYAATSLNEASVSVWVRKWLQAHEVEIQEKMLKQGHGAFVLQVNYAVGNSFGTQVFMSRDIYLLGTIPMTTDAKQILTPEKMFGPQVDAIPNNATKYRYAYLIGQRR